MSDLQTIKGHSYSTVDDRCLTHPGCIVDLGCLYWDWSKFFIGKKRVVGADPFEKPLQGVEFYPGLVGPFNGNMEMTDDKQGATSLTSVTELATPGFKGGIQTVPMLNWRAFCTRFKIDSISVLKMNIEGGEYPLLASMRAEDFLKIDQIAISCHDWMVPGWRGNTAALLFLLDRYGFTSRITDATLGWYLAVRR